jgi:hypothetical protein
MVYHCNRMHMHGATMSNMKDQAGREAPACVRCTSGTPDGERLARAVALYGTPSKALRVALRLLDTYGDDKVPYAAVTPAAKSAHGLRLRVANLEAALERAEAEAADARRDYGAAVTAERRAVVAWLRDLAVDYRSEGLVPEDYALCEAAQAIEAGVHRPGGDP